MPQTPHIERHFTSSESVRDIVIGMSDGLTVPFALAAGLSGAVDSAAIIVTAGLAEIAAGSIAMGLGGFLAARSDAEHYASEKRREEREIIEKTDAEVAEVTGIFRSYGLNEQQAAAIRAKNVLQLIAAGGNAYYLAKFAGIFQLDMQDIGAQQTGMTKDEFKAMLVAAGRD